jgi:PAS domain S-box-containing protein
MKSNKKLQDLENKIRALEEENLKQKRRIESLIESQDIQDIILERSLVGYYISWNGKFYAMNSIAVAYTGYSMEELIGRESDFMIHPEDREDVKNKARAMLEGELTSPYEFRIITKQKEIRWVLEAVAPVTVEGKRAILANAMDITQRKIAEKKLIESENLYRAIFENTGTMTTIADEHKIVTLVNSEWENQTGYRKEEWEGKRKWTEYIDKRDLPKMEKYHRLRRIDPQSVPRVYECRMIDSQDRVRNVLAIVGIIPGTQKNVSSAIDITELKETEKELITKTENLAELNTALKVLLKQREEDRAELENTLLSNVKELVMPYIEKIRQSGMDKKHMVYIDLLESNLENILSPFSRTLSTKYMNLTSKEIEVANFIKGGKSSKEIADLLNISSNCVDIHRYHIRSKLGLNKKHFNLRSYLNNLS